MARNILAILPANSFQMKIRMFRKHRWMLCLLFLQGSFLRTLSQTDVDAIMMNKNQFCSGLVFSRASWDHYWEGTQKRTNENLGTVSTSSLQYMANYGITNNLNVMASAPYIWTRASSGTMHGLKGFQDLSLFVKWKPLTIKAGQDKVSVFLLGGFSTPVSNYVIDYLPFSIGLGSTNLIARGLVDYQHGKWVATAGASFIWRSNIYLDRGSYYDTRLHLTNEIKMPHAAFFLFRTGYRGKYLLADVVVTNWTTIGGFDITKNNMPFPSNRMNSTSAGISLKYTLKQFTHLSFLAGANYTVAGRNTGQAMNWNAGAFYAFYFKSKSKFSGN